MKIPCPETAWRVHSDLHNLMKATHPSQRSFERFKQSVRDSSSCLNLYIIREEQSIHDWRKFIKQLLSVEPAIRYYENYWPVRQYYDSWSRNLLRHRRNAGWTDPRLSKSASQGCKREQTDPEIISIVSSRENTPSLLEQSSAGEHIAHYENFSGLHRTSTPLSLNNIQSKPIRQFSLSPTQSKKRGLTVHKSLIRTPYSPIKSNAVQVEPIQSPLGSSSSAQTKNAVHHPFGPDKNIMTVAAVCSLCEPPPIVDVYFNNELRQFARDEDTLRRLASVGIYLDHHLDTVLKLDNSVREKFFEGIRTRGFTTFSKIKLLQIFNGPGPCIPCPSLVIETFMIDPNTSVVKFEASLCRAMQLDHEEEVFKDLLQTMDKSSCDYFYIYSPHIEQLEKAIRRIANERPYFFEIYDNYWPIKIYLKRRKNIVKLTQPQFSEEEEELAFINAFMEYGEAVDTEKKSESWGAPAFSSKSARTEKIHSTSLGQITVDQVPCQIHSTIDVTGVSATIRAYLHAHGIGDLIPAFARIGVFTDDDFTILSEMTREGRERVMALEQLRLSVFQKFMLMLAFSNMVEI